MEKYSIRVSNVGSGLYGGENVTIRNETNGMSLIIRNDEFAESVLLTSTIINTGQPATVFDHGSLGPGEVLMIGLDSIKFVRAQCTAPNFDTLVHCTILKHS